MESFEFPLFTNYAPDRCFCGRKTVESHEFWFCSTECARQDALRSLGNPQCHYRRVIQASVRASARELHRMMSAEPSPSEQHGLTNLPIPSIPPKDLQQHGNEARFACHVAGFPSLSQVTGKVLSRKANAGEPFAAQSPGDHSLRKTPQQVPARILRRVSTIDSLRTHTRRDVVAALANSRNARNGENPERIFAQPVNPIIPAVRKESLPSYQRMNFPAVPSQTTKALRRSVSLSARNTTPRSPTGGQDPVMHIIEEMREELSESFDPKSLFDQEVDD